LIVLNTVSIRPIDYTLIFLINALPRFVRVFQIFSIISRCVLFDANEWVESSLDRVKTSTGYERTAECPFCGRYGGFYVNVDPAGTGPFVCFKCDERSKSMAKLIAHVEDITLAQARAMMMRATIEFRRKESTVSLLERIKAIRTPDDLSEIDLLDESADTPLPKEFIPIWDGKKWRVPKYLTKRGFKRSTLRRWGIGYCQTGWFAHRVIIPLVCPNGNSFTARDLTGDQIPKYLNPKHADHNRLLFGWEHAPIESDFSLVEGPLDAMKWDQHGLPSMAVGGKVLHAAQLSMLFKRPRSAAATVALDPEAYLEALGLASQLLVHFERVYVARLPIEVDPGASTKVQAHDTYDKSGKHVGNRAARVKAAVERSREKLLIRLKD
jgi:hypothetical protein